MICSAYFGSTYCDVFGDVFLGRRLVGDDLFGREILLGGQRAAFDHRVGDLAGEQADGAQRVVVARDHPIHFVGIAVGVDDRDHRDAQPPGFLHRDGFLVRIDHEDHVRQPGHVLDAGEVLIEMLALALQADDFLLGTRRRSRPRPPSAPVP